MVYDIMIIGGGTAGLTSGIYGARAGKSVIVFEGSFAGGLIVTSPFIENYPAIQNISGPEFATNLLSQAEAFGTKIVYESIIEVDIEGKIKRVISESNEYIGKTVIIATGTKRRKLGFENEDKLIGKGLSYCAYCDGAFFRGKDVAVVGGGNTALEDALYLSDICKTVYIIHRRDKLKGEKAISNEIFKRENIKFLTDTVVDDIIGDKVLNLVKIRNLKTGEIRDLSVNGLFVAIGQIPQNEIFSPPVTLDSSGYIFATEDCKTNVSGVFVAGDCRVKKLRQLITASADGATAVNSAIEYLNEGK